MNIDPGENVEPLTEVSAPQQHDAKPIGNESLKSSRLDIPRTATHTAIGGYCFLILGHRAADMFEVTREASIEIGIGSGVAVGAAIYAYSLRNFRITN